MNEQSNYGLGLSATAFLAGVLGVILRWISLGVSLFFLIFGFLGVVLFGMPVWKAIYIRLKACIKLS
ncbi:MAG TPA: hypothetical protein VMR19_03505 [Candidatus Saccharimonadales bacterium]|jgi:apolipoprotein N-acyltransferase|nr:hypothetical protein [Candidatus Saccharimonadales bacterium]